MSRIHLLARDNGAGLTRDLALVADVLARAGFDVTATGLGAGGWRRWLQRTRLRVQIGREARRARRDARFDAGLSFEMLLPEFLTLARRNALIPNPEWFRDEYAAHLGRIDRVFAKTRHAIAPFEALGADARFVGFTSLDRLRRDVPREPRFLHLAGRSGTKGTRALIALWRRKPAWPTLTIVQREKLSLPTEPVANLDFRTTYLDEAALTVLANRCVFHLCPSETEGFGHHIVEGLGVGAVLLTTDAPPMNELVARDRGILVPYARTGVQRLATTYFVDEAALEDGVERMLALDGAQRREYGERARDAFEQSDRAFRERIVEAVAGLAGAGA
ncbi:MAG TPA: glycosyl transferase family 1 [Rhodanobacteraceae bacterium]|nr:glycosyl transferase family 1 [Rhodanobacteraceae bacterium]